MSSRERGADFGAAPVVFFAVALVAARLLAAHFSGFFGLDEVSLANGVAALARHSSADVYRYGPQAGYYRLFQGLVFLAGGNLRILPQLMIAGSAVAGAIIPVAGLFVYRDRLSRAERLVLALVLAANPIIWTSSTYGNTAMPSVMFATIGFAIWSNRPSAGWRAAALVAFGLAILIRADQVLMMPAVALVTWQARRSIPDAGRALAPLVVGLAVVYGLLFAVDPRMAATVQAVTSHLTNGEFKTHFWDYLLWSTSPILLLLAALGIRELLDGRREILLVVALWCLPYFAFYYSATTTPRYFVPTALPIAILSAVGAVNLPRLFAHRRLAAVGIAAAAGLHLLVSLGDYTPGSFKNRLTQGSFETQIGPMPTGALLYQSYLLPRPLGNSVRHLGFHRTNVLQRSLDTLLAEVGAGANRGHTVVALLGGWNGRVIHYYAALHGATYRSTSAGPAFLNQTWFDLGDAKVMSIGRGTAQFDAMPTLPVAAGDEIWVLKPAETSTERIESKLASGLTLMPIPGGTPSLERYRVLGGP